MGEQKKTKKELLSEMKTLLLRIEELEAIERKYRALTQKIQSLASHVLEKNTAEPVIEAGRGTRRATVLVVDDNDVFRKFMQEALLGDGYTVYVAESAAEAIHILDDIGKEVDLMVADVIMPDGGGRELCMKVNTLHPHIKVLFVSGYSDEILIHTDVQEVVESKVAFLQKPFHVTELLTKIEQELGER